MTLIELSHTGFRRDRIVQQLVDTGIRPFMSTEYYEYVMLDLIWATMEEFRIYHPQDRRAVPEEIVDSRVIAGEPLPTPKVPTCVYSGTV